MWRFRYESAHEKKTEQNFDEKEKKNQKQTNKRERERKKNVAHAYVHAKRDSRGGIR